jgi:DNA transposition AAA+ family ATPase
MDLKQFLSTSGISVRAFARMCGTSASSVIRARDVLIFTQN